LIRVNYDACIGFPGWCFNPLLMHASVQAHP